jgi:hypothetical protein
MSRHLSRGTALVAGTALALSGLVGLSGAAHAAPATEAATGAKWLAGELTGGLIHNNEFNFDDHGLSIDVALGLDAVEQRPAAVNRVATAVATSIDAYTTFQPYFPDPAEHVSSGPVAKAAVLAQAIGQDPTAFGGRDLVAELEGMVSEAAGTEGRVQDVVPPLPDPAPEWPDADYANVIGQSYAARALGVAGSDSAEAVTDFLLEQQCDSGAFRVYFSAADAPEQGCVDGAAGSEPDTDATALAVLNLKASGDTRPAVTSALTAAGDWLAQHQRANGSFGGGTSTAAPNTNSTGLAGWALGELGRTAKARKAAVWVRTLQPADLGTCSSKLTKDAGAVAYDQAAVKAGRKGGLTAATEGQWQRATSQALPVLRWAPKGGKLRVAVAKKKVKRGKKVQFTVRGLANGEQGCIWVGKKSKRIVGTGKAVKVKLGVPKKVGRPFVKVRSLDSNAKKRFRVVR